MLFKFHHFPTNVLLLSQYPVLYLVVNIISTTGRHHGALGMVYCERHDNIFVVIFDKNV